MIIPVLAASVGIYSPIAMLLVCLLAFGTGSIIRYNIQHAEPILADNPKETTLSLERASDLALILAYIISVSLYLHILSTFVLGGLGISSPFNDNMLTTAIIVLITGVGGLKGLHMLSELEVWSLGITLVIIALVILGFLHYDLTATEWIAPKPEDHTPWEILTIVAGTLIVVQGFETPRYLGELYDPETRIRASRLSQIISTSVYLVFVTLALPILHTLNGKYVDNSLIAIVAEVSSLLVAPLVIAAAMSQFSAAVADTLTATENMEEITHEGLKKKWAYLFVGSVAIALTWSADTFQILTLASRAFAFYYMLQCFVAISIARSLKEKIFFSCIGACLAFITVFAVPVG